MSRPRRTLDACKEGELVLQRLAQEAPGWRRERLLAVKLGLEGQLDLEAIAGAVGRSRALIQIWFDRYREGGVAELLTMRRGKGPKSLLTKAHEEALKDSLGQGVWRTAPQAQKFLAQRGLKVKLSTVYNYLGKLGARLRVPRPTHLKKDPAAATAFKENLAAKLEALEIDPARPVRVWVMDEMRCGLHTHPRRVWGLRGERPTVTVQQKYQWQYVYGALEVGGGATQFWYAPTVDLVCNQAFLQRLGQEDPASVHVVIYDGAGFHHRDGHVDLPDNVRIITLPPYSPELNPAEKLWDVLRDAICNQVFATIADLQRALSERLQAYWQSVTGVLSLLGSGWLLQQTNSSGPDVLLI